MKFSADVDLDNGSEATFSSILFFNNVHAYQREVGICFHITTQSRVSLFDFHFYQNKRFSYKLILKTIRQPNMVLCSRLQNTTCSWKYEGEGPVVYVGVLVKCGLRLHPLLVIQRHRP